MLGQGREQEFRAAGVPIAFSLRGKFLEYEEFRRLTLALTLSLDRSGAGIETITQLDFAPEAGGTRVSIMVRGPNEPHMLSLGKAHLEGQLDRLGRSLGLVHSQ